ncbi:MAG: hypothetical protein WBR26_06695 [Candidatus Acidiferrum sp.]
MDKKIRTFISALCGLVLLAMLGLALPVNTRAQGNNGDEKMGQQSTTVSGSITSVAKNSFTMNLGPDASQEGPQTFEINKGTKVHGDLKVGATAKVTYRQESNKNLAMIVRVMS